MLNDTGTLLASQFVINNYLVHCHIMRMSPSMRAHGFAGFKSRSGNCFLKFSEREIKEEINETIPFTIHIKIHVGINLCKEAKDLYSK